MFLDFESDARARPGRLSIARAPAHWETAMPLDVGIHQHVRDLTKDAVAILLKLSNDFT